MPSIMRCAAVALVLLCAFACQQSPEKQIQDLSLGHASRIVPMTGQSESDVVRALGAPTEYRTSNFEPPRYGKPPVPSETDMQLIFRGSMQHTLVYFSKGKVIIAVQEWSDY